MGGVRATPQEMNTPYFDEQGRPVGVQQPEVYADDPEADDSRARRELIARLIDWTVRHDATPEQIGRRLLLLAYVCKTPSAPRRQADLAERLGVSPPAVCRAVKRIRREMGGFGG